MIVGFQEFRRKWERYAEENGDDLMLVSDNPVYDGMFLNVLIEKYTEDYPIPYTALSKVGAHVYDNLVDLSSVQMAAMQTARGVPISLPSGSSAQKIDAFIEWLKDEYPTDSFAPNYTDKSQEHMPNYDAKVIAMQTLKALDAMQSCHWTG